jgi:hypothetical protein
MRAMRRLRPRASSPAPRTSGRRSTRGYASDLAEGKTLPNFTAGGYEVDFVQNTPFAAGATDPAKTAALAAIEGLTAKKPIYVGPLKDNKTGKVVIDKTYDNLDPTSTRWTICSRGSWARRLSGRRADGLRSNAPLATGASRDLIGTGSRKTASDLALKLRANSEYAAIPLLALAIATALFALFLLAIGKSPVDFVSYVSRRGFGTAFSFQNELRRSAPLILTVLAVAIPRASVSS